MPNILFVSNISGKKMSYSFSGAAIEAAHKLNYRFYSAANRSASTSEDIKEDEEKYNIRLLHIDLARNPFSFRQNYTAYKQLCEIIKNNNIDFIHCNTPVGGLLGRLAGKKCKVKKIIYQAHGFHFYKGAPLKNWLIYYTVEKWLAHYTDAIITINNEDFGASQKLHLKKGGKHYFVPGVGIDLSKYLSCTASRSEKRAELGLKDQDIFIISTGDLIKRKNFMTAIKAIHKANDSRLHYFICGRGPEEENMIALAKQLGVDEQVHILGYRTDITELLFAADIFLFTTIQEGLSRSLMEAMATGLPCVASSIRGNVDLIDDGINGFLSDAKDFELFSKNILKLSNNKKLREQMGKANLEYIKKYDISTVTEEIIDVYSEVFEGKKL